MRIIAVMSPKGGIGKTTTSDSIAYMLGEEQGKRVLVLDGDPQGDTSKTFGVFEPDGIGMSELLEKHECVGGTYKTGDLIRPTEYSHVDIIPANGYLMKTDMNLLLKSEDNQVTRLRETLQEVSDAYDYCICDCGRLLDMVVINILISAELIIAPVKVGGYEIEALQNLEEQIEDLRDINPDLRMLKIMSKTDNSQTAFGQGQTSGYVNDASQNYGHLATGTLTDKGQFFGYKDTTHEVKVFYIEKWWGNRWDRINGLLMVGGEILAKMTPPYNLTGKDFEKVGITFASSGNGYQKGTKSSRFGRIVNSIGGSSSTYTCDYFWWNAGITAVALVGGSCNAGEICGADCLDLNSSAGSASWNFGASVFLEQPIAA